jgi:hypothetical protein
MVMALPLPMTIVTTLGFMALGGGRGPDKDFSKPAGINTSLPDARFKKEKQKDKLSFYEAAEADSLKLRSYIEKGTMAFHSSSYPDSAEMKLNGRMNELKKLISSKPIPVRDLPSPAGAGIQAERLRELLSATNNRKEPDPELKRLGEMLDKIMLIQHPEKLKDTEQKRFTLPVAPATDRIDEGFYSLPEPATNNQSNTIRAEIENEGSIIPGSLITLLLLEGVTIKNFRVPEGTLVYGTSSLNNERLDINIKSIRFDENIFPVNLRIYDLDGQPGISIPGSMDRDMLKQGSGQMISGINPLSFDPSIGAQAAGAGIEVAKSVFSKKMKIFRVSIPVGYKVLLIDESVKPSHNP